MGASEGVWGHLTALSARAQGGNKTPPCLCPPHLGAAVSSFKYKCSLVSPAPILDCTKLEKGKDNYFLLSSFSFKGVQFCFEWDDRHVLSQVKGCG